jgi:hypothetical protein
MRRFSIIIVLLAGAFYYLASGTADKTGEDEPAGNDATNMPSPLEDGGAPVKPDAVTPAHWQTRVKPESNVTEAVKKPAAPAIVEAKEASPAPAESPALEADSEDYAATHIPSSTNATQIDQALAKLSLIDLKTAAQQELARLGCYGAKIDGLWGPQSRAAVQAFNSRVVGGWDDSATAPLVKALRSAPDGLCQRDCSANAPGESCVIALSEDGNGSSAGEDNEGLSYLPPWMRGKKLASTDADALMMQPGQETAQPSRVAPQRARKSVARTRVVETRRKRPPKWVPSGWPGANR